MEHNVDVQALFSPILLSVLISMVLQGILLSQIYNYFVRYKNDAPLNKYLVLLVFVVEALNTAFSMHMIYQPLVLQFGRPTATSRYPFALATEPALMVAVSTPVQFFVAWRIRLLRRSIWIPLVICTLALTSFAGGTFATYQIKHYSFFANRRQTNKSALLWLISGACADLLITMTLSWSLYERKTGVKSSDAVISRIIRLTVQTGLITSVAAVANIITLLALPAGNTLNFIFNITLMKLYGNFLLATLNARSTWNNGLNQPQTSLLFDPSPKNTGHRVGASIGGTADNVHFQPNDKANYHAIDLPDSAHLQRPVNGKVTELSVSIETVTHRKVDLEA